MSPVQVLDKSRISPLPNIFDCTFTFSKEIHGSYSWHPTKSQKAVRNDKITRTLIISRKSYWARMKGALTQAKFKLNNQKVQVSGLSGFILSALKSLKSSKISLCSSKTVFNAAGLFAMGTGHHWSIYYTQPISISCLCSPDSCH